jgi:hypothetical protein
VAEARKGNKTLKENLGSSCHGVFGRREMVGSLIMKIPRWSIAGSSSRSSPWLYIGRRRTWLMI